MATELEILADRYKALGIDRQMDYEKFYLYSIITHSTAIEGSTLTELENQIMFDEGVSLKGKSLEEQLMNLDLKAAYEKSLQLARGHADITVDRLKEMAALVMKNTGQEYRTALGDFSSAKGELRLLNVTAGIGGKSYMSYNKVPGRLQEFCEEVNAARRRAALLNVQQLYEVSFDAHFKLVTIHPWADGNGRMARLVMNQLQFEFGLIPCRIFMEDKEEYIKALVATREAEDLSIFRRFMTGVMVKNLSRDIHAFLESTEEVTESREETAVSGEKKIKNREKILALLEQDNTLSAVALAGRTGISAKAVEKHLARLKADGIIERIGPAKGGHWKIL